MLPLLKGEICMLNIIFVMFLSMFFLQSAYGMQDQKDLMQNILEELKKHEKFSSKQSETADPEIIQKIQNKKEFERLKDDIKSALELGIDNLIATPDKLTILFYNFYNLFFDLSFLPFSMEIHFGKEKGEKILFDEYCKLHDEMRKKDLAWDELWVQGGFDKLKLEPLQEKLVVALSLLSQTTGKYSDTKYEFLHAFKLSLIRVLASMSESFPCSQKWGKALVTDNKIFKDTRYVFNSANKEFLAKEFESDLHLKYVIDSLYVDIVAEANQSRQLQLKESEEKQRITDLKKKQYDEFVKNVAQKDKISLTKLCKEYIRILCDPYISCIFKIVKQKDLEEIMESFNKLVSSIERDEKKKIFTEIGNDTEISFVISVAEEFINACSKNTLWAFKGVAVLKKRLQTIKDLIAQESEKKTSGKNIVTLQDLQRPILKKDLIKLKKTLNILKTKLEDLQNKLRKLSDVLRKK